MNECLVTKLKSHVNDENLRILGGFRAKVSIVNTFLPFATSGDDVIVEILTEGAYISRVNPNCIKETDKKAIVTNTYAEYPGFHVENPNGNTVDILVKNKYCCSLLPYIINLEDGFLSLSYVDSLTSLNISSSSQITDSVSNMPMLKDATSISLDGGNISGTFKELQEKIDVNKLTKIYNKAINEGNIEDALGSYVALTRIDLRKSPKGSIEAFVERQRSNGRVSCDKITCAFMYSMVSFNGRVYSDSTERELSWTSSSITFDGTTIQA